MDYKENGDDIQRRTLEYLRKVEEARRRFAAGVNANRKPAPTIACAGCAKTLTPAELAGVTRFGPLCAECNAGLADVR